MSITGCSNVTFLEDALKPYGSLDTLMLNRVDEVVVRAGGLARTASSRRTRRSTDLVVSNAAVLRLAKGAIAGNIFKTIKSSS